MHYVKHFDIDGVATRQAACIELHGKPNAATEGYVGVLGIDMDSPLHDVYKCVAVNGSIYTWDLLSSGLSIMSSNISGGGAESVQFPYSKLKTPSTYVVKIGDLILDGEGYLYQINGLNVDYCVATYCGTRLDGQPESDPTVPAWAKQPNKPTYTPAEIGAAPAHTWGTEDIEAGSPSTEPTGTIHLVIE